MVLIETLWNVKEVAFVHALDTEAVLIETLWNVKKLVKHDTCCTTLY